MAGVPHLDVSARGSEELKQRQEDKGGGPKTESIIKTLCALSGRVY